jgi:hypothetical protein
LSAHATKTGYGKAGKQKPLSNFPTATTTTKYIQLWDTDSKGKVKGLALSAKKQAAQSRGGVCVPSFFT